MEKAKLQAKVALCVLLVMMITVVIAASQLLGQVSWHSVAVLLVSWWSTLLAMFLVIKHSRAILGFIRRVLRHQRSGPSGYVSVQLVFMLVLFAATAGAIYAYGDVYMSIVHSGNNFEAVVAGGLTVLVFALAKIFGYHRQDTKAAALAPIVEREKISLFA